MYSPHQDLQATPDFSSFIFYLSTAGSGIGTMLHPSIPLPLQSLGTNRIIFTSTFGSSPLTTLTWMAAADPSQ
jgi:hypothetical protein